MKSQRYLALVLTSLCLSLLTACQGAETKSAAVQKDPSPEFVRLAADSSAKGAPGNSAGLRRMFPLEGRTNAPQPITAGVPVRGTLNRSDQVLSGGEYADFYSYSGTIGEAIAVTLRSEDFDARVLAGANRNGVFDPIAEDDDSAGGTDARIEFTLPSTGVFTIMASSYGSGETGDYVLDVARRTDGPAAAEILPGMPASGRLESSDLARSDDGTYYDVWLFEGRGGANVTITLTSDDFDAYAMLMRGAPGDMDLLKGDDDSGGGLNSRITATLPETGVYTVIANSVEKATGAYTLLVESAGGGFTDLYPGGGDPAGKYGLIVGVSDYPGEEDDLAGPASDAQSIRDVLAGKLGFKPENIVVLRDSEATRERILVAVERHLGQAGPAGTAFFYFSGHGMQIGENLGLTSPIDPEDGDNSDEALFVWGTNDESSLILDDEIGYMLERLQTDRVVVVIDACNSGTVSRADKGAPREVPRTRLADRSFYLPRSLQVGAETAAGRTSGPFTLELRRDHVLLAASKDVELSWETDGLPGRTGSSGVFTHFLVRALEGADSRTTFRQLMDAVGSQTKDFTERELRATQTPQVSGALADRSVAAILR